MERWKKIHGLGRLRHEFLDQIWRHLAWLTLILIPLSLFRIKFTGWLLLYGVHLGLATAVVLIAFYRQRLPIRYKAPLLIGVFWMVGVSGVFNFGLASAGLWWLMMGAVVSGAVYSLRHGIVMGIAVLLVLLLFMLAFATGLLEPRADLNRYNAHPAAWVNMVVGTALCIAVVVRSIVLYHHSLVRETEHRFQQWVEDMPTAMLVLDSDAQVSFANSRARDILGYSSSLNYSERIVLNHLGHFYRAGTDTPYPLDELPPIRALKGEPAMVDDVDLVVDGRRTSLQIWGKPGVDWRGNTRFAITTLEDITERRRAETMKSEFVATVSHELRTPLTSIRGSLGLLKSNALGELPEKMQSVVNIASTNTDRLLLLINDILDMQKIATGHMSFSIAPVKIMPLLMRLKDELSAYAHQFGVSYFISEGVAEQEAVLGDENRLIQALGNLMSNAAKFSPPGASVTLAVRLTDDAHLCISVRDQGLGIPEDFKAHIFEPFSQADTSSKRNKGGTGLGLAITKDLIERQQGSIHFVSEPGEGTCFYVTLPRALGGVAELPPSTPLKEM